MNCECMEKISKEFVKFNLNKLHPVTEKIFYEFDSFYGLDGKKQLDRVLINGGLIEYVEFLEREYNKIPYSKRNFLIV